MSIDSNDDINSDIIFRLMGNRRRRLIAYFLQEYGELKTTELAQKIAAIESDKPEDEVPVNNYKSVYVSMQQTHLPKLEKEGFVELDSDLEVVTPTDKLLRLRINVEFENEYRNKVILATQFCVVAITSVLIVGTLAPDIVGYSIDSTTLMISMPLLSIILALVYYIQKKTGPNVSGVSVEGENQ